MLILSHRGIWKDVQEKNSVKSFHRSFELGFGTETDIRDYKGELVISHDIATGKNITFKEFLEIYIKYDKTLPLALNIKADGLQYKLKMLLEEYKIDNYFVFDMSVPDAILYIRGGFKSYTRHSEFESPPSFYGLAKGVWLDQFEKDWFTEEVITKHLNNLKEVCVVSPELHNRDYLECWGKLKKLGQKVDSIRVMLCTDYPEEARQYFCEQN